MALVTAGKTKQEILKILVESIVSQYHDHDVHFSKNELLILSLIWKSNWDFYQYALDDEDFSAVLSALTDGL